MFATQHHSRLMTAYFGRQFEETVVYTLGNPLFAKDMLQYDMCVALNVPPRVLVQAMPSGGTRVMYDLPSSWYVVETRGELKAAMENLDEKLEAMLIKVLT